MKRGMLRGNRGVYAFLFLLMFLSFSVNIFGVGLGGSWYSDFEKTSEELTTRTIECADRGTYKGNLVNVINGSADDYCKVYPSQFGLQGFAYSLIGTLFESKRLQYAAIIATRAVLAAALTAVMIMFVRFVHRQYDFRAAITVSIFITSSVWLVGFADKMYWVVFLFFLPFIYALYAYPLLSPSRRTMTKFYGVLFGLFFIKFLCGYEYLAGVALAAVSPVAYWEIKKGSVNYGRIIRRSLIIIAVSVLAFMSALLAHVVSLTNDYGSFDAAISAVQDRGEERSFSDLNEVYPVALYNFISMQPEIYRLIDSHKDMDVLYDGKGSPVTYFVIMAMSYAFTPVISLPVQMNGFINVIMESFIFWLFIAFIILSWLTKRQVITESERRAFYAVLVLGILGAASWLILAVGHSLVHAHMNAVSFYMPLMLWVYLVVGVYISHLSRRRGKK